MTAPDFWRDIAPLLADWTGDTPAPDEDEDLDDEQPGTWADE